MKPQVCRPNRRWTQELMAQAARMRGEGMTMRDIGGVLGFSAYSVSDALKRHYETLQCEMEHAEETAVRPRRCSVCRKWIRPESRFIFRCDPCRRSDGALRI